jgi:large subunit ribosomal protein L25
MKSFSINGTKRAAQTRQEIKNLRAQGMVPCVLYGGKEQTHFSAPVLAFKGLVYTPDVYTVDVTVDGVTTKAIMKDIQFHPVNDSILHIDFLELNDNKNVVIELPVRITGNAVGVRAGGQLITKMRKLKISALPKDLPDFISVSIDNLNIGDGVRVRDIQIPGVELLDSPNNVITSVKITRAVATATDAAPAAGAAAAAPAAAAKK